MQLELELLRTNCEEEFHSWFNEISTFAESLSIPVSTPRTTSRQLHRANIAADSPEVYYRRNIMVPFLDHITTEMETRFGPVHQTKIKPLALTPSIAATSSHASIEDVSELYKTDLPSHHLLSTEFNRRKIKCSYLPPDKRPDTLQTVLQFCNEDAFPNTYVVLVIACTLPVTTCETERKTYLRSTMGEERLSDLAVIKVHRRMVADLDFDQLVADFSNKHPRRMTLSCVLSD